jgi:hypothetical protein
MAFPLPLGFPLMSPASTHHWLPGFPREAGERWRAFLRAIDRQLVTPVVDRARHLALRLGTIDAERTEAQRSPVRVLRWVFTRDLEHLTCELTLASDESFELTTKPAYPEHTNGHEHFRNLAASFQRQCELEAALIDEGWTLESHESILA